MRATNNKEKDQSQEKCDIFRHYNAKSKSLQLLFNNLHKSHGQKSQIIPDF
jgi:hypothetical protein